MRNGLTFVFASAAATWLMAGCSDDTGLKGKTGSGGAGSGSSALLAGAIDLGGSAGSGGSSGKASSSSSQDLCSGKGPVVTLPTSSGSRQTCTGSIAATRFQSALCTCNNASLAGYLRTRAFDSSKGSSIDLGGSVGINQSYENSAGYSDIGGSFSIAGNDSLSFAGYVKTGGDLRTQGSATVLGYTEVARNMWVANGYNDVGPVKVAGDLHASGAIMAIPLLVKGKQLQEAVTISPPCPCGAQDLLNVGALVTEAKTHNDNAKNGIRPDMFNILVGNAQATLPCGKFYIEAIGGIGNVIFNVTGRVALFIDGSIANTGNLEFRLSPAAEIDIFIRDNLAIVGRSIFGPKERPAAARVYVGGDGDVMLVGDGEFVGFVYAPRSLVHVVGYGALRGGLFARDFVTPGFADFVYDVAIKYAGDTCDTPVPPTCTKCGTCTGGKACVGGKCTTCRTDDDCCGQMVCEQGQCINTGLIY